MVKGMEPGIYSATYSGIPVYEYQFGVDLKEHVMRRRSDDWINATHILKAAGFDKPARTRILEREVQKDPLHEKIQGGYGKYQGTWIPLEAGEALARRNQVYERLQPIFEFEPGLESPPPAPRHTSKPKQPKPKPAVPKWGAKPGAPIEEIDSQTHGVETDTPDNITVASASYMGDDDGYDMSQLSTGGNRKRKREEAIRNMTEQAHAMYGDELLDYFLLSRNAQPAQRPEPPTNFQPDWIIDSEQHTALHWAAAMGDMEVIKQLKRFGASLDARNIKGETPLIRAVYFTNCYEKLTFQQVARALFDTVACRDNSGCTVIHHAASMKNGRVQSHSCARHYLDIILNRLQETHEPEFVQQLIDAQDNMGNTALHLAAQAKARKCIRALLGRGASTDIPNNEGVRAEDLIRELNSHRKERQPQRSSSPFAPDSQRHTSFRDVELGKPLVGPSAQPAFRSQAAQTVQSRVQALVVQKFADLAASYEEEWRDKDEAEKEAQRILDNTRHELANVRALLAEAEQSLDPPDVAANTAAQVDRARQEVLALVTRQSRIAVQEEVEASLLAAKSRQANGEGEAMDGLEGPGGSGHGAGDDGGEDSLEDRLRLAHELAALVEEQRRAEVELVDAMSLVGTGDQIDRYRELLRKCLDPRDAESLDANLDSLIEMMEEDGGAGASTGADAASGAVPLQGGSAVPPMLAGGGAAEVGMLPPHHHSSAMEVSMVG